MKRNYHTHTVRCGHASGTEREYIEKAISEGIEVLGFSDHAPYIFTDGRPYSDFRIKVEGTEEYFNTIRSLAEEYRDRITIIAGLEMEYYPGLFERNVEFVSRFGCDYLLQGQHYCGIEEFACGVPRDDKNLFERHTSQLIEGMETGVFTYVAHPDMWNFTGDIKFREKQYLRICEAAKKLDIPLEINMLGMTDNRHYPTSTMFEIAAQVGNRVTYGCDTHSVDRMANPDELKALEAFAAKCGVKPIELTLDEVLAKKHLIK